MVLVDNWYSRPRLFEIADQSWCPAFMRKHEYTILEYIWSHHMKSVQDRPLYELAADIVGKAVEHVENGGGGVDGDETGKERKGVQVVDFCSGAGGPTPSIEKVYNTRRKEANLPLIPFSLSDLRPHPSWPSLASSSPTKQLTYVPHSVDATDSANMAVAHPDKLQVRTLFVSFHHMDQEGGRRVIEDAMRHAESLVIVEMSDFSFAGCILGPIAFTPMAFAFTPRLNPSWAVLLFTYIVPLIPIMFWWDALISGYRTYAPHHILHLSKLAEANVNAERVKEHGEKAELVEWEWEFGRQVHTKPSAVMIHAVGRRRR